MKRRALKPPHQEPRVIDAVRVMLICREDFGLTAQQAARALGITEVAARRALRSLKDGFTARAVRRGRRVVFYSHERTLLSWVWD